jgi:hypothetical protein
MNEAAPIAWLLSEIDRLLQASGSTIADVLAKDVAPVVAAGFCLWLSVTALQHNLGT